MTRLSLATILIGAVCAGPWRAEAAQINLVSDTPGLAQVTDPNLVNPWGITASPTSPFWIGDQGANVATLYSVNPSTITASIAGGPLVVSIPQTGIGARDRHRVVGAAAVDHDALVAEREAVQTFGDVAGLVAGDDDGAQARHGRLRRHFATMRRAPHQVPWRMRREASRKWRNGTPR